MSVIERGDLQFFFQPTVQPADAIEVKLGVQSLFAIMSPAGGEHRRLRIGRKRMPSTPRERFWARIERVGTLQHVLGGKLEDDFYTTKTRGARYQPAARPVASGTYELVRHDDHVHFIYAVERLPFEDAPDELELAGAGDHLVLFEAPAGRRATWTPEGEPRLLDIEGAELVLVGSNAGSSCPLPPIDP